LGVPNIGQERGEVIEGSESQKRRELKSQHKAYDPSEAPRISSI
jgi:hypothetical protein